MPVETLAHAATIALVGNFNPAIFAPSWLALNGLISREDAETASLKISHPQISDFIVRDLRIYVEQNRFTISTTQEPFVLLSDWASAIFGELLSHTPIVQAGITYNTHFALSSEKQRHALGRAMAPLEPWGKWGATMNEGEDFDALGGLRSIAMLQQKPDGRAKGYRQVQLEPSVREDIVNKRVGVYMLVTDHYEPSDGTDTSKKASTCIDWISANFDQSIKTAKEIVSDVYDYAANL